MRSARQQATGSGVISYDGSHLIRKLCGAQRNSGYVIPNGKLAREVTEVVRDTESPLLFHHSSRVYYWGALTGKRRRLRLDPELLYAGAMFHNMGRYRDAATQSLLASGGPRRPVDCNNEV